MAVDQYREDYIPASRFLPDVTVPPTSGTRQETTLKGAHYDFWAFDDAADAAIYTDWMVPEDFDNASGKFSVRVYWETPTTVATEGVNWDIEWSGVADNADIDIVPETSAAETESLADGGAARDLNIITIALSGAAALTKGEFVTFSVRRDVDGTHDDLTDDANFIGLGIQWNALGASNAQWS